MSGRPGSTPARGVFALVACGLLCACRSPGAETASNAGATAPPAPLLTAGVPTTAPSPISPPSAVAPADDASTPQATTDWCVEGLAALDEETCYVLADEVGGSSTSTHPSPPRVLLIYLHGIVPPTAASPQKERVELAVLHAAKRAGAAALVPRGLRGIGPGAARDWWAWPTEPVAYAKYAAGLVARWADARRRLERILGAPFARTYLAGSSNGAYFLTTLALRGDLDRLGFPVDGYAAISGGSAGGRSASSLTAPPRPFYVGYGAYDESTRPSARALAALLALARWKVRATEYPVGHGAREEYLDEAFAFWAEAEAAR